MTKFTVSLALCMVVLIGSAMTAPSVGKVSQVLQRSLEVNNRVNIFISMHESVYKVLDEVDTLTFATRGDKATAVYNTLVAHAAKTQKQVLDMLSSPRFFAIKVQSFWISNQVYVQGADAYLVSELAKMDEVASIDLEAIITLEEVQADPEEPGTKAEWGVDKINSQQAWAAGFDGTGSVVGIIDTGARATHEAIRDGYRGGTHSWYNPYTQTQQPGDGHGHGTHVTGTIAGSRASGVGVAPGAKWISCKGLQDNGSGTQAALLGCGQFMACPHTYNGGSPNCALAPHAVSNSWGGGAGANWYDPAIRSWHSANIIPVFAMGNSGPACGSANSPGDSAADVLGIGATTTTDAIASFSSRGPGRLTGATQKPDVSAPGNAVRSAGHTSDTAYTSMSGTSMACPHVAGVVGLLKGKNPATNYTNIKRILETTAHRVLTSGSQTCSGVPDTQFPNYTFGHGRVNALAAVQAS